jgi:hypothetical protein
MTMQPEPAFGIGQNARGAEFRHSDVNGRPIDPRSEGDTARSERIWALQDRWQEHAPPVTDGYDVLREWMAASPANRMSKFAQNIAEHGVYGFDVETEPGPGEAEAGRPGGARARGDVRPPAVC